MPATAPSGFTESLVSVRIGQKGKEGLSVERRRIVFAVAVSFGLLALLTGCPSIIANVVSSSESLQQAIDEAAPGDTIRFMGSHQEDVIVDKDGLTLKGDVPGATIQGNLTVTANNVTTENFTVGGDMTVDGDQNTARDMTVNGILDTPPGSMDDFVATNFAIGGWDLNVGGFGVHDVDSQATVTLNGTFSCADIVQPSESIQTSIDNTDANANKRPICVAGSTRQAAQGDPNGPPLTVDKSVNLLAMGPVTLEVTSGAEFSIVRIEHGNVRLEGFTVTTDNLDAGTGVNVVPGAANVVLRDLTITQTRRGIDKASGSRFKLRRSTIKNNQTGILISAESSAVDIQITRNNIEENTTGINYSGPPTAGVIDAEQNWFGDSSGPNDAASSGESTPLNGVPANCTGTPADEFNSSGLGDDVVDNGDAPVDYCPWATSSF